MAATNHPLNNDVPRFAALVPVGPSIIDLSRGMTLLYDLVNTEPEIGWCVIADNSPTPRGLSDLAFLPRSCRTVALQNQTEGRGRSWSGGLTTRIISALAWIQKNTNADFVLRLDTDALVIAPFAERIRAFIGRTPAAGLIGTIGLSCNPEFRQIEDLTKESKLLRAHRLLPLAPPDGLAALDRFEVPGLGRLSVQQLLGFNKVRAHIHVAAENGYSSSEFCQGGGYAVTRLSLDRMAASGCLDHPEAWTELPFSEDRVVAMFTRAVELRICDYSLPGEVFGMNFVGLAFPPAQLAAHGYSLIHSICDDRFDEHALRAYFHEQRQTRPA